VPASITFPHRAFYRPLDYTGKKYRLLKLRIDHLVVLHPDEACGGRADAIIIVRAVIITILVLILI